jgi:hypothetical protein
MRHSYLLFAAGLLLATPVFAADKVVPSPPDPQVLLRRAHRSFVEAGFVPISEVIAEGRSVRRLRMSAPFGGLAPSVEVECHLSSMTS